MDTNTKYLLALVGKQNTEKTINNVLSVLGHKKRACLTLNVSCQHQFPGSK